jgi:NAD(P)-dependent dehydrogenase (short-subunit alcohol dehydrogenase family)
MTERSKRVVILADTQTHMMPALARELARQEHDLVLGDPLDGLAAELSGLGARVEVVDGAEDQTEPDTIQKLVDRSNDAFGGFDAACIRTGVHGTGSSDLLACQLVGAGPRRVDLCRYKGRRRPPRRYVQPRSP